LQVGDQAVMEQSEIILREGGVDPGYFRIKAICQPCAKPMLISREASLYKEVEELSRTLQDLNESHQLAFEETLLTLCWDPKNDGGDLQHRLDLLKRLFPNHNDEFLNDPRCAKHPEFLAKRKRRFFHEARLKLEKDGFFIEGKAAEAKSRQKSYEQSCRPAISRLVEICQETKILPGAVNGQYFCAYEVDLLDGVNLNPNMCGDSTIFTVDGESGGSIYFPVYTDGLKENISHNILTPPLKGTRGNELTPKATDFLIEKIKGVVEGLVWPTS
jgi:hypothetical protein